MTRFETLASGYGLIEGPTAAADGTLFFSDVRHGGVYRLSGDGTVDTVVPKRRGVGGIAVHRDGGLVISGRTLCHVRDGATRDIWSPDAPGLNDLTADEQGRVYVGVVRSDPFSDVGERIPGECVRIDIDGTATVLYGGMSLTNGLGFSPDGSVLYHSDTWNHRVVAHDVDGDELGNRRDLGEHDGFFPDGLAVDEAGTVWVADANGGRVVGLSPSGEVVATIAVPARMVTSLCFAGADRRDLVVVTADNSEAPERGGTVFRARVDVPGVPVHAAAV